MMKNILWSMREPFLAALLVVGVGCALEVDDSEVGATTAALSAANAADRFALAHRWAPIHYQDVDQTGGNSLGGASDYITRINFDGGWNMTNNWESAASSSFSKAAYAYYSVAETSTHWYIVYMFYHPRDWTDSSFDQEHENDTEGLLLAIQRDGTQFGKLKAAVTVAHVDFYSYLPAGSTWVADEEDIDGTLQLATFNGVGHPVTAQEAKGHGLKARPYYDIQGGDGVVYYPSLNTAEVPSSPNDRFVYYRLVDIFSAGGLWDQLDNPLTFASYGTFAGNDGGTCGDGWSVTCSENSAKAPWGWDDHNDGPQAGALALDPLNLVRDYFNMPGEWFATTYSYNPYL